MISRQLANETQKQKQNMYLLQENQLQMRDYCKEEFDKVREEMQQLAKFLENRFSSDEIPIIGSEGFIDLNPLGDKKNRSGKGYISGSIGTALAIDNLKEELIRIQDRFKKEMSSHREEID